MASAEQSFSRLKRIHTYLRNNQAYEGLSNLSIISFYDDLNEFLMKDRRI